jgi:hypothetical protein
MVDERKIRMWTVGEDTFISDGEGNEYQVYGYGSMKDCMPDIDPRIDLTAPIFEQVQKLAAKDRAAEKKAKRNMLMNAQ